jgi:hypothetical protein
MASSFGLNLGQLLGEKYAWVFEALYQFGRELKVAIPGVVVSFDAVHQTVTVQPALQEDMLQNGVPTPVCNHASVTGGR